MLSCMTELTGLLFLFTRLCFSLISKSWFFFTGSEILKTTNLNPKSRRIEEITEFKEVKEKRTSESKKKNQ